MEQYELAFIVDADLDEAKREKVVEGIKDLVVKHKGNPGQLETWGKRDFTFPINKKMSGVYYLQYFASEPTDVSALDKRLRIEGSIMRYLLVRQKKRKVKKLYKAAAK